MSEIKVIANPLAGRGRGQHTITYVSKALPKKGLPFNLVQTEYPGHATELARLAVAEGYKTIVALGGDGTINEVVNGLCMDLGNDPNPADVVKLGIIPAGSGNDFAYAVGLPPKAPEALDRLAQGTSRLVDMGRINDRFFAYGVGIGFDAEVNIESQKIKWLRGMMLYLIALLKVLIFQNKSYELEITFDDTRLIQQAMMVSVANGRRYAGAFLITPDAQVDDGLLNLCIVSPLSRLDMLRFMPLVFKGYHTNLKVVKLFSARQIKVKSSSPLVSHVDGEVFGLGEKCYEFSLLPGRLRVIC
jgi:diacylglycerol kinase (ATP)